VRVHKVGSRRYLLAEGNRNEYSATEMESEMIGTVLIVILVLALIGALPSWPHSRSWGYAPTGGLGLILVIVLILVLLGRI
jgi:Protein of unknown function (DUF3309)